MPASKRILVADDDSDILDLMMFKLGRAGYEVTSARTGAEALAALQESPPDLAVLDVMMPGMSGLDVLRALRADADLKDIKVILLTARSRDVDVDAGYEVGADDYMVKPFSPRELVHRVESLMSRAG